MCYDRKLRLRRMLLQLISDCVTTENQVRSDDWRFSRFDDKTNLKTKFRNFLIANFRENNFLRYVFMQSRYNLQLIGDRLTTEV